MKVEEPNKFEKIQGILSHDQFRYLYLGSLISADSIMGSKDNCKYSYDSLVYIKENVSNMNLTDEVKAEILKFVEDGLLIIEDELNNCK